MAKVNAPLLSFNRGVVSPRALARVDIEKLRLAAEIQTNWLPTVLGPMTLRPGFEYIATTRSNAAMYPLRFVFSNTDWAILELTSGKMRVRLADESLVAFNSVSTSVTNGDFNASAGWTLTSSGVSTATITGGQLDLLNATNGGTPTCVRSVSVAGGDVGVEHCLYINVTRGPVTFRAGSASGLDDYIAATALETGVHYLALTPTGSTFYVGFEGKEIAAKTVDEIAIFTGTLEITTPWTTNYLPLVRYDQSADVLFVACYGLATKRIERRSAHSWSLVEFKAGDGPFLSSFDGTISITPTALLGAISLQSNHDVFRTTHVGALFRLFHSGQVVSESLGAIGAVTSAIRVNGVGVDRTLSYTLTGVFTATVILQRSFDGEDSGFINVSTFTGTASSTLADSLDNSIVWYRFKVTAYTSGTIGTSMSFSGGGGAGVVRIIGYTSATGVTAEVLSRLYNVTPTFDWREGAWSDYRGYPTAVRLHEGRLFFASGDHIWGSVSDAYTSFDYDATGDSAPIDRTIGYGPVDTINWLLSLNRLVIGREGSEITARSSSLDEPLTPTNFNLKDAATLGSARLPAVKVDRRGVFVQQGYRRIYDLTPQDGDYAARELTRLAPEICTDDVVAIAVQRQPDTRIHFILADGTAAVLVYDIDDDVVAWWTVETDGQIENVVVMPGAPEDKVYYLVKRTINGSTVRYLERHARFDQCSGLPDARLSDAHLIYSGVATTTITGLSHLEGETVVVWGYTSGATTGKDLGTYTVASGQITGLTASVVWACVGLAYTAAFKSAKLAYGAQNGTALTQIKRPVKVGLILHNTHYQGVRVGPDADNLDPLPLVEDGLETPADTVWSEFDQPMIPIPGAWDTDSRLYIEAASPRPATVMAAVVQIKTHED